MSSAYCVHAPKGQPVRARGGTPGTTPHNALRALKGHTERGARRHRSPRWGEVAYGAVTQGSAPLLLGLSPRAALRRRPAPEAPGCQRSVPRINSKSVRVASRWRVFGGPCWCPEGATGESPGWNPGNHVTQRPPCPEGAHETGSQASPFAPLGRGPVGGGDPGLRSAPPWAVAVRRVAAKARARSSRLPEISSPDQLEVRSLAPRCCEGRARLRTSSSTRRGGSRPVAGGARGFVLGEFAFAGGEGLSGLVDGVAAEDETQGSLA